MEPQHFTDIMHSHNYCDDLAQPFPQHHNPHCHSGDLIAIALVAQGVYNCYQKWKMRRRIKKYLKIVVEFSNLIQDEKNILQDMIKANIPREDIVNQHNYVIRLIQKQNQAIRDLVKVELEYPGEIHNRFFYFRDKPIY